MNLAIALVEEMQTEFPAFEIALSQVMDEAIKIEVIGSALDLTHFSGEVEQMIEDQPISCFSISAQNLDRVFSKLVQSEFVDAVRVRERIFTTR